MSDSDDAAILPTHFKETARAIAELQARHERRSTLVQRVIDRSVRSLSRPRTIGYLTVLALMAAASLGAMTSRASPSPSQPGGYGPIRLGMMQADVKSPLNRIARDVVFLPTSVDQPLSDIADKRMDQMAVMTPWEDVYVGRLDADTRIQVGTHGGRVVSVMLRTTLVAQGRACRTAFTALVKRNEAEYGPVPVTDMPDNPQTFSNGKVGFSDWTLYLGRIQTGGNCYLSADYLSNSGKGIETNWRARLRDGGSRCAYSGDWWITARPLSGDDRGEQTFVHQGGRGRNTIHWWRAVRPLSGDQIG